MQHRYIFALAAAALLTARFAMPVVAGGIEHDCFTGPGADTKEQWAVNGSGFVRVPWELRVDVAPGTGDQRFVGNYPCRATQAGQPLSAEAGAQSLIKAAQTWNLTGSGMGISLAPTITTTRLLGQDGVNLVTCVEQLPVGAGGALAITNTFLAPGTTVITEADIGFNPNVSWVELNTNLGVTLVSQTNPNVVFADLEGTAVHEFGHFAGLGHSLLDSSARATGTSFPTMFVPAQIQPMTLTTSLPPSCPAPLPASSWPITTIVPAGGVLGQSARTLEGDDVTAIFEGYPQAIAGFGTITGTVLRSGFPNLQGASVVAIQQNQPETFRSGTLSYSNGAYTIAHLPAGNYFVYVENVDLGPVQKPAGCVQIPPINFANWYFTRGLEPSYLVRTWSGCFNLLGCLTNTDVPILPEFFDGAESATEGILQQSAATAVTVTSGGTTTVNFDTEALNGNFPPLGVRMNTGNSTRFSPRGVQLPLNTPGGQIMQYQVTGPANASCVLTFADARTITLLNGHLQQVQQTGDPTFPAQVTIPTLGSTGVVVVSVTFPSSPPSFHNVFAQAAITSGNSTFFTNVVNVWWPN
jgi:hypothetical protein